MPLTLERFMEVLAILALISAVGVFIGWKWGWMKGGAYFVLIYTAIIGGAVLMDADYIGW